MLMLSVEETCVYRTLFVTSIGTQELMPEKKCKPQDSMAQWHSINVLPVMKDRIIFSRKFGPQFGSSAGPQAVSMRS